MLYALEQGPTERKIIEQSVRQRLPLPDRILNAPELGLGLELFYNAFNDLTPCRAIGFGEGPIPWLAIDDYCRRQGITGVQREDLLYHVQQLDTVYLEYRAKQVSKQTAAHGGTKGVRKAGKAARS